MASFAPESNGVAVGTSRQISQSRRAECSESDKPQIRSKPNLKDLLEELKSVVDWQPLMINLNFEKYKNDKIEKNFPRDVDRQKEEAFDQWLRQKSDACWKDIIDALYKVDEDSLARKLTRKYDWIDPRGYVNLRYLDAPPNARLTVAPVSDDLPCRRFLPQLTGREEFYGYQMQSPLPRVNEHLVLRKTMHFNRLIHNKREGFCTLFEFLQEIERSSSKSDFKVGLEARFGKMFWRFDSRKVLPPNSTTKDWVRSKLLRKAAFNTEVKENDVKRLFEGKERLGKEAFTRITLEYDVEGRDEGTYSAIVHENVGMFYLDAVYRQQDIKNRARIDITLVGRKYDLRISDCSECILLESETSTPFKIAKTITESLCGLPDRRLQLILRGTTEKEESSYKIKYIRQRVQRQYKWKPERKWILAQYDVDIFNDKTDGPLKVDSAPLNEVFTPEFDYSRKEVELWGRRIYPKDVNKTHPSREKYYYMEGVEGVRLPGGEIREPFNWTAEDLMSDFEEFLGDAFKIAYILDGSLIH